MNSCRTTRSPAVKESDNRVVMVLECILTARVIALATKALLVGFAFREKQGDTALHIVTRQLGMCRLRSVTPGQA